MIIIHKEKQRKSLLNECLYVQFLDQNNPKSNYYCKNELIYFRDFEAAQTSSQSCYQI